MKKLTSKKGLQISRYLEKKTKKEPKQAEESKEIEESEEKTEEEIEKELSEVFGELFQTAPQQDSSSLRVAELYGIIDEEMASNIVASMFILRDSGKSVNREDEEENEVYKPFELFISTPGGTAVDMFAIYDTMRMVKEDCEIHTIGMGKVMSAGVLLLAAGTKGKRRIGANCRVMIHSVIGGHHGSIQNLENEMEEVRWVQQQHNKALCEETDLTPRMLKKLLSRNVNVYLTAQEAVEYGIADIIV
jgi:ATP-dependent Clp protease protease subunit